MGRQVIIAALCWLTLNGTLAVNVVLKDSVSADSGKRLYRNTPYGVYASAAPYGAYSFPVPYIASPKASAYNIEPVKQNQSYLKDSYGNQYVPSSQSLPLKPLTPQQFLQLQALPPHFAQPIPAAPVKLTYNQATGTPQAPLVYGVPYKLPIQSAAAGSGSHYGYAQAHPGIYGQSVKGFVSPSVWNSPQQGGAIHIPGYSGAITFQQPASAHQQPATSYQQPATSYQQPATSYQQPATSYPQPATATSYQQPATSFASQKQPVVQSTVQLQSNSDKEPVYTISSAQDPSYSRESISSTHAPIQYQSTKLPHYQRIKDSEEVLPRYQRVKDSSEEVIPRVQWIKDSEEIYDEDKREAVRGVKVKLQQTSSHVIPVKAVVNGKKAIVNVETKPLVPLLDISLLEPLTFDNPLVPQVQHYLPRIHEATYHKLSDLKPKDKDKKYIKEYVVQKTKSYDSGYKPKKTSSKRKHKRPAVEIITYDDEITQASTARPTVVSDESPEISYEINAPNYKETYNVKAVNYNKETKPEPVHITYGTHTRKEPVTYSYVHSSKEPVHIKEVHYESNGGGPKQTKQEEQSKQEDDNSEDDSEESDESSEENDTPYHEQHRQKQQTYKHNEHPHQHHHHHHHHHHSKPKHREEEYHHHSKPEHKENEHHHHHSRPEHREEQYHHHSKPEHREEKYHHHSEPPQKDHHQVGYSGTPPAQHFHGGFQPVAQYEEEIQITAPIKVDPNQHVQKEHEHSEPRHQAPQSQQQTHQPQQQTHQPQHHSHQAQHNEHPHSPQDNKHHIKEEYHPKHHSAPQKAPESQKHHHSPPVHVQEKTKQVYIQQETPEDDEDHSPKESFIKDEDNEKDFEKAYKNAAFGFPAYNSKYEDIEKEIYNPDSYGVPRESSNYDIKKSPFKQYYKAGDDFPKTTRSNYMDARDKTKENYFLDFSINRPESLADRYTKKVDYLKLYNKQKPDNIFGKEEDKKEKQSEKYSAIPMYDFYPIKDQQIKQAFAHYTSVPIMKFERRDNSAFASKPYSYKINTHFVEPQFQYGFEPIALPRLLDSELAAMASNDSPENEKPGMRKKIYKENFYIKKTSTSNEPSS